MTTRHGATARSLQAFGQRAAPPSARADKASRAADDGRLFALTFAAGFLFMSVYLA